MALMSRRADLVAVLAVAVLAQFGYFALSSHYFYPDSETYLLPARNMVRGLGFVEEEGTAETLRTPGYPLFLAPFLKLSARPEPIVITQHLLSCLLAVILYLFALRETSSRRVALLAAMLFALDPLTFHYANKVLSENLFTLALFGVFVLTLSLGRQSDPSAALVLVDGLLMGVLVLIRPVAIAWFAVVAIFFGFVWWSRLQRSGHVVSQAPSPTRPKRPRHTRVFVLIAAFASASVLLPLLWGWRNQRETEVFTVSSIAGANMMEQRAAGVLAILDRGDFTENLARHQKELEARAWREMAEEYQDDPAVLDSSVRADWSAKIGRPIILAHPVAYGLLTMRGLLVNLFESDWGAVQVVSRLPAPVIAWPIRLMTAAEFLLACIGLVVLWRTRRDLALLSALTIVYFVFISAGGESEARFRTPVVPMYALAAAVGARKGVGSRQ
jgi:Dolichyl-phosphate-mannose-protein mannosyltransferase